MYKEYKIQPYISDSKLSNKMKSVLFAMRISMTRGIRKKCAFMYFEETTCPLPECDNPTEYHQHHLLTCSSLKSYLNQQEILKLSLIEYEDIFGSLQKQIEAAIFL